MNVTRLFGVKRRIASGFYDCPVIVNAAIRRLIEDLNMGTREDSCWRKARTLKRCQRCDRWIEPGERYFAYAAGMYRPESWCKRRAAGLGPWVKQAKGAEGVTRRA